jgi:hypothetical protein
MQYKKNLSIGSLIALGSSTVAASCGPNAFRKEKS